MHDHKLMNKKNRWNEELEGRGREKKDCEKRMRKKFKKRSLKTYDSKHKSFKQINKNKDTSRT